MKLEAEMKQQSAQAGARPLRPPLWAHLSVEAARVRLAREGLSFLLVVVGPSGRVAGVVTPESVRPGPCCVRRAGSCSVVHHLDPDAAYCFAEEPLAEVLLTEAEIAGERRPPRDRSAPLLVVDRELRPLGYLPHAASARALGPLQAA
jgi:hypothetical protein